MRPSAPAPVAAQPPAAAVAAPPTATPAAPAAPTAEPVEAVATAAAPRAAKPAPRPAAAAAAAPANTEASGAGAGGGGRMLDLHGLTQSVSSVTPTDEPGADAPKGPAQCISAGQVQQVLTMRMPGIKRSCWERNPSSKPIVNVNVSMDIGPDGTPQNVTSSGDEPSIAKCIENDVRGWRFPAMGCSQKTQIPFKLVRQ
ncbi:MAG TPA: hypothetical protein VE987_15825 [Polyangiaceae bacterium]|nr:hypothetical protein [Polyangiaceae bacterium]